MPRGRPKIVSDEDVIRLRNAGFSEHEIADDLQCNRSSVQRVLRRAGMTGGSNRITVERQRLLELWESTKTLSEIGAELNCAPVTVVRLSRRHQLPPRQAFSESVDVVAPDEDAASAESLRLSPWVQARIKELGIGVV